MLKHIFRNSLNAQRTGGLTNLYRAVSSSSQNRNGQYGGSEQEYGRFNANKYKSVAGIGIAAAGLAWYVSTHKVGLTFSDNAKSYSPDSIGAGRFIDGMPVYTSEEVAKHQDESTGIWISYKNGVYDITKFIKKHPGGSSKIKLAAGGSVEPFWSLYAIHQQPEILALMEEYRIGNLTKGEENLAMANMDDPYANEPRRHPVLQMRSQKPCNAEPPPSLLVESFITPTDIFYVRNHLPVPDLDDVAVKDFTLEVAGSKNGSINLNLEQLKTKYPQYSVTASLQCCGNRRSEMNKVKPVKGLQWTQAAMGNAIWRGPRLRDVLLDAGFKDGEDYDHLHVQFEGMDLDPTSMPYGASIPMSKAMDPRADVILAYEMNGETLNRDHGFPLRVIVPGTTGARWVKWLARIEVSEEESESHWQKNDYKSFSPSTDWDKVDFSKAMAIQEMPVTSVVCDPQEGDTVKVNSNGNIKLKGYAWSGGGRSIARVDVSLNCGATWSVAELVDPPLSKGPNRQWAWTRWEAELPVKEGQVDVWVRAVDSGYNTQPETMEHIWNLRGLLAVGYHKIKVSTTAQ